jgi:hypothetical protein
MIHTNNNIIKWLLVKYLVLYGVVYILEKG